MRHKVLLGLGLLLASQLQAQHQVPSGVATGIGFVYVTANGDDFEGTDAGPGIQASLRYTAPKGATVNLVFQFSAHNIDGLNDNLNILGLIVEPGYTARIPGSAVAPFVRGRLGYVRQSITPSGVSIDGSGAMTGLVGGMLFQVGPIVAIETDVSFNLIHFGDLNVEGNFCAGHRIRRQLTGASYWDCAGIQTALAQHEPPQGKGVGSVRRHDKPDSRHPAQHKTQSTGRAGKDDGELATSELLAFLQQILKCRHSHTRRVGALAGQ